MDNKYHNIIPKEVPDYYPQTSTPEWICKNCGKSWGKMTKEQSGRLDTNGCK